jgi:hypothetical protein
MRKLIICVLLLLFSLPAGAANHFQGGHAQGVKFVEISAGTETVGTATEGALSATMTTNSNGISGTYFTPTHSGTLTTISMYSFNTSATVDLQWGLFEYTSGTDPDASTLVGTETQITNPGTWDNGSSGPIWKDFTVNYSVVAGHHYRIAWNASENSVVTYYYSEPGGTQGYFRTQTFGTAWVSPFGTPSTSTRLRSIKGAIVY